MRLSFDEVVHAVQGEVILPDSWDSADILSVSTDSRKIEAGGLFVAVLGEKVDGHNFARSAGEAGARAILAQRNPFISNVQVPVILVQNTVQALGRLAYAWRKKIAYANDNNANANAFLNANAKGNSSATATNAKPCVIGITGSAGKTSVKEMLAQVLSTQGTTAKNYLNMNNQLGLPLSMLATTGQERFWVMEIGISHPQDMDELASILEPNLALVLNVGSAHTEGLGDLGVAHYKAQIFSHLAKEGMAFACADYPDLVRESRKLRSNIVFFSAQGKPVAYRSTYMGTVESDHGLFRLWLDGTNIDVEMPFRGAAHAENVIAVAAVAHKLGLQPSAIASALAQVTLPQQRFSCTHVGSWQIIDDSYNANPLSMVHSLNIAQEISLESKVPLLCVLGEMGELGAIAQKEHERLGKYLADIKVQAVLWKGRQSEAIARGLHDGGYTGIFFTLSQESDFQTAFHNLNDLGIDHGVILFKGSRANHLENLVQSFSHLIQRGA